MFENIGHFFKRIVKTEQQKELGSKDAAKERLHLVLMQDRANVSADFLELMKQEIIDVIKKYIVVDESAIDVRLTNQSNEDGTNGAPALYANIPIVNIKNDMMAEKIKDFEGVDFNKEMGILVPNQPEEEQKEEKLETPQVIELSESYEEAKGNETSNQEEINNKTLNQEETNNEVETEAKEENSEEIKENNDKNEEINNEIESEESEEPVELFEEVDEDEDDDDVTFDDLLKAAEEEDKNVDNIEENNSNNNNKNYKSGKKNHKKSKDKRNKRN